MLGIEESETVRLRRYMVETKGLETMLIMERMRFVVLALGMRQWHLIVGVNVVRRIISPKASESDSSNSPQH